MKDPDGDHADRRMSAPAEQNADSSREPSPYEMQWPRAPLNWSTARWWLSKMIENDPLFWPIMILCAIIFIPMIGWLLVREVIEFLQQF